jgi:hypothetical protein
MSDENVSNRFLVAVHGERVQLLNPPKRPITKKEALNLAAWLVALADPKAGTGEGEFTALLAKVLAT